MNKYELEQEIKWLQETKGEMQVLIDILKLQMKHLILRGVRKHHLEKILH